MTLHLTLHARWFDAILLGIKTTEYREIKPYWTKRLEGRPYTQIHFRNGYSKGGREMIVEYLGVDVAQSESGNICYGIKLGRILETKHC